MENNLEDILVDNIEEKPTSKSKVRLIIIAIASLVLLAVLGTLAYVLLKGEPKKNPEFNNTELEKIVPQETQPDEFDKLIAEIKSKDTANQAQTPISTEVAPQEPAQKTSQVEEKPIAQKTESKSEAKSEIKPEVKTATKTESKVESKPVLTTPTATSKTQEPQKNVQKQEVKKETHKKNEKKTEKAPSASKAFESVKTATAPKGFYLQVGVFGGKPQAAFVSKISSFQYKTETLQKSGKVLTRYLIGPYSNRAQAEKMIFNVMQAIGIKPIVVEIK